MTNEISQRLALAADALTGIEQHAAEGQWLLALDLFNRFQDAVMTIAADMAQEAYNAGATKRAVASALGVSPRTFVGMERTS